MGQDTGQLREEIESTRNEMGDTVQALADKADVPGRVKGSIAEKRDRFKDQMSNVTGRVSDAAPDTGDVKGGAQKAAGIAQENPLGLALGGVALGFLAGLALPSTRVENEKIGPMADDVKELARDSGQEALERGKQVAQEAASSAADTAREVGQEQAQELKDSVADQAGSAGQGGQEPAPQAGQPAPGAPPIQATQV
jgi:gas vesicle protein